MVSVAANPVRASVPRGRAAHVARTRNGGSMHVVLTKSNSGKAELAQSSANSAAVVSVGMSAIGLATVLLGTFLGVTDVSIVNVALPTINMDLRSSPELLQMVVAGYAVPFALLLVLGGRLGD